MKQYPPQEILSSLFEYDSASGVLVWRARVDIADPVDCKRWNIKYAGQQAGCVNKRGYRVVTISGTTYYAHRIVWKLVHGSEPTALLDHRNGEPSDNRIGKLREATHAQNCQNRRTLKNKKSGLPKGVTVFPNGVYQAVINRNQYLGSYTTCAEAKAAYDNAALMQFGEFARLA